MLIQLHVCRSKARCATKPLKPYWQRLSHSIRLASLQNMPRVSPLQVHSDFSAVWYSGVLKKGLFKVRLSIRGGGGMALTVRKCEHFGPVKHWNLILWYLKHFLSYFEGSKKCHLRLCYTAIRTFCDKAGTCSRGNWWFLWLDENEWFCVWYIFCLPSRHYNNFYRHKELFHCE